MTDNPQDRADRMIERICGTKPTDTQGHDRKRVTDTAGLAKGPQKGGKGPVNSEDSPPTKKVQRAQAQKPPRSEMENRRNERRLADR